MERNSRLKLLCFTSSTIPNHIFISPLCFISWDVMPSSPPPPLTPSTPHLLSLFFFPLDFLYMTKFFPLVTLIFVLTLAIICFYSGLWSGVMKWYRRLMVFCYQSIILHLSTDEGSTCIRLSTLRNTSGRSETKWYRKIPQMLHQCNVTPAFLKNKLAKCTTHLYVLDKQICCLQE